MLNAVNPYIAGSPVTGSEMFFGREDVFTFIRQALIGKHRDNIIVLYGQRRTGKTSTLYQLPSHLGPHYLCVFVDLQALHLEGIDGFLWELANRIQRILQREHQIELPPLERQEFMADARNFFQYKFLDRVWSAIDDRHLLLMLDEAIRLEEQVQIGKLEPQIFEYMSHLMQHYERLNFLFSLGSGLEEIAKEYTLLFRTAVYKKISFLDRGATSALITNPVKDYYEVEDAARERIFQITSGHPYCIQLLCHNLFNRWQQHPVEIITVQDVEQVLDEAVERGLAVFKHIWEESTSAEKAVMAAISQITGDASVPVSTDSINQAWKSHKVRIPQGEIAQALKNLIARDVIKGTDTYVFCVDLQRMWIQKYRRFDWVAEEIAETMHVWATTGKMRVTPKSPLYPRSQPRHRIRLWQGIVVLTVAIIVISLVMVRSLFIPLTPTISVTSDYHDNETPVGANSTTLHITGKQFASNSTITFLLDSTAIKQDMPTESDANGNFSTELTVTNWHTGSHKLTAHDTSNNTTNTRTLILIVPQGSHGTPGPNGAPSNTANFKINIEVRLQNGSTTILHTSELDVTGRPDSDGGTVCSHDDNGPEDRNDSPGPNNTIVTHVSTYVCDPTNSYTGGQITYNETLKTNTFFDTGGACELIHPQSSFVHITGTYVTSHQFSGDIIQNSISADQYHCTGDLSYLGYNGAAGTWTGTVSNF